MVGYERKNTSVEKQQGYSESVQLLSDSGLCLQSVHRDARAPFDAGIRRPVLHGPQPARFPDKHADYLCDADHLCADEEADISSDLYLCALAGDRNHKRHHFVAENDPVHNEGFEFTERRPDDYN